MSKEPKKESFEPIHIRFPYDLKKIVKELAAKEQRTFTDQLIYLVKKGLTKR